MARTSDPIETFASFLVQAERSPLTIKNYRGDLAAFAAWFEEVNGEPMAPAKVTSTDLRQFKRCLVEQRAQAQQRQPQARHSEELPDLGRRGGNRPRPSGPGAGPVLERTPAGPAGTAWAAVAGPPRAERPLAGR
ncbi:MAG: site-specific integrase [Singulisphaera sp.]